MPDINVTGPDGSTFTFPSGTATATITNVLQSHYAKPAGMFDDLIPKGGQTSAAAPYWAGDPVVSPAPNQAGMFDDLIPKQTSSVPLPQPRPAAIQEAPWSAAVTDIPNDIRRTAGDAWEAVKSAFNPYSQQNADIQQRSLNAPLWDLRPGLESVLNVGHSAAAIPQLIASPVTGAAHSLIGHTLANTDRALGNQSAPQAVAQETPEQTYDRWRGNVDTMIAAVRPSDASPIMSAKPQVQAPLAPSQVPSVADLEASAKAKYNDPAVKAVQFTPQATQNLAKSIDQELLANKVDVYTAPQVKSIVDRLNEPRFGPNPTIDDLDMARQSLNSVPPTEYRAAQIAKGQIDDYLGGSIPQADLISGDAATANQLLTAARGDWAAAQRAREVERLQHNADIQAGSTYSGGNLNNATRQQLRPLLKVKKGQRQFTPPGWTQDETDQLARVVVGTPVGNAARLVGKLGPDGKLGLISHLIAAKETGGASIPVSLATMIAKRIGEASTQNQADLLGLMLRSRSPLAQSVQAGNVIQAPVTGPQAIAAAIASRQAARGLNGALPAYANDKQRVRRAN